MNRSRIAERIISQERLRPYLIRHNNDLEKALSHYKINILISQSFYPILAILEIGLRNSIDYQLTRKFNDEKWFDNHEFVKVASRFHIDRISKARTNIMSEKKAITPGKIISELSFGFWTSLFDLKFEMTLWKNLRLAFPNCPKQIRQRKTMSAKFNGIRKLRNRIFHHEPIAWNLTVLRSYKKDIIEGLDWLNDDLINWTAELNNIDDTIDKYRKVIE